MSELSEADKKAIFPTLCLSWHPECPVPLIPLLPSAHVHPYGLLNNLMISPNTAVHTPVPRAQRAVVQRKSAAPK